MRASNQFADATTGVVYVHASPAAVCPHVEWALSSTLSARANLKWTRSLPCRGSCGPSPTGEDRSVPAPSWPTRCGRGPCCASRSPKTRARAWTAIGGATRLSSGCGTVRWAPTATSWSARCGCALLASGADTLAAELDTVLGTAWDEALEPCRGGGDTGELTWLNRGVG